MSLSGTLDTFALPDVLRLLATTRKSGRLDLDLDLDDATGHGGLWLVDGKVAAAAPPAAAGAVRAAPPSVDVLFELLRCREGSFTFEVGVRCELDGPAGEVEVLLAGAEELLAEWREIEAVVPSLRTTLSLRAELTAATATVTSEQWRLVVGVGSGTTVGALGAARGLGELAVSRAVKGLVEAGLVEVGPAAPGEPAVRRDLALSFDVGATVTDAEWRAELRAGTPVRPPVADDAPELAAPWDAVLPTDTASAALSELAAEEPQPVVAHEAAPLDDEAADVARRLSDLSPDAAAAVAAVAEATTVEERDAAIDAIEAEVDVDGEPVNRSALLKFLSSVRA